MVDLLKGAYLFATIGLSIYGYLGIATLWLFFRHRDKSYPAVAVPRSQLPPVTVQLPIFNERFVVERLIRSAISLDYPADRLQIQILDDSTDDTTQRASELVRHYREQGRDIALLHRPHRVGFKAGALEAGLKQASGEYVAIFDADFQPNPDFLRMTIPHFVNHPWLGMVQARWGHLNYRESLLTAAQAIALDKHFAMEQTVRHWADMFPKFNGAGGVWRKACVEESGGWHSDTLCEDLCLSTRAILKGWRFRFLNDVVAPAELPVTINAYKNQQARWATGSVQCLAKYGLAILRDHNHSWSGRLFALLSMSAYGAHPLFLLLLLSMVPLLAAGELLPGNPLLVVASLGQPLLFILAQYVLHSDWRRRLTRLPAMLLIAMGIAPSNSRAILSGAFGGARSFIRTPKGVGRDRQIRQRNVVGYDLPFDWIAIVELLLSAYSAAGLYFAIDRAEFGPILFTLSCALGFGLVATLSLRRSLAG